MPTTYSPICYWPICPAFLPYIPVWEQPSTYLLTASLLPYSSNSPHLLPHEVPPLPLGSVDNSIKIWCHFSHIEEMSFKHLSNSISPLPYNSILCCPLQQSSSKELSAVTVSHSSLLFFLDPLPSAFHPYHSTEANPIKVTKGLPSAILMINSQSPFDLTY